VPQLKIIQKLRSTCVFAAVAATALASHAADLLVSPNEHYFQDWIFNVSNNPRGCFDINILPSNDSITGTLGTLTYSVTALDSTTLAYTPVQTGWVDCRWSNFGTKTPAGNDQPASIDTTHFRSGNFLLSLNGPLPSGSVLFMQDFDGQEISDIEFRSCTGATLNASSFDFLRVSDPSLPGSSITIPSHTPGATWNIAAATTNSSNETSGIVIRRSDVCQIAFRNTKPSQSGGRHFFLGHAPVIPPAQVPVWGLGTLLFSSIMVGAGALLSRRRNSKLGMRT